MSDLTLSERSELRKALIAAGVPTRGLTADQLQDAAREAGIATQSEPRPEPTPEPPSAPPPTVPATPPADAAAQQLAALLSQLMASQTAAMDESRVIELIREHSIKSLQITVTRPDSSTTQVTGAHPALPRLIKLVQAGLNPLLVGPAGSGKTHVAPQLAEALGRPYSFTGAVAHQYELFGVVNPLTGDYLPSALYTACKDGHVFLWDEMDASNPAALVAFNALLSNRVYTWPNGETLEVHPDTVFLASANTKGAGATRTYVGRNPLDGASLDRFFPVEFEYTRALELRLALAASERLGGDSEVVRDWVATVQAARVFVEKRDWPIVIGMRASIQGAAALAVGESRKAVMGALITFRMSADQRKQYEKECG